MTHNPYRAPWQHMVPQKCWSYKSAFVTPALFDAIAIGAIAIETSVQDWEALSPGMRREIVRTRNKMINAARSELQCICGLATEAGNLSPTQMTYSPLDNAFTFFNKALFGGTLPGCLITVQRKAKAYGYFSGDRFINGSTYTDEIALNPQHFADRTIEQTLSTLVHEMVHLWQHHFGLDVPKRPYHNREWADKMISIGLHPSETGLPGGRETGPRVSHYIVPGGLFAEAVTGLAWQGGLYADRKRDETAAAKKRASKTKYTCPGCGLNSWAKPDVLLVCGECEIPLEGC